ncbi:uncharacterized protein LOC134776817 [Penaeus indicus]|uniref:uncharacterized protein LOC134776817 n=1 Tax=Penaeus indicus TaxID=29960 RepID=UPI00300DB574
MDALQYGTEVYAVSEVASSVRGYQAARFTAQELLRDGLMVPDKVKGKLHKLMVRPAMLYGLETVPLTKSQEGELEVAEMRMMRYEVGVTRLDKIKNETTREILGIERYGEKIRESRLSWFGHEYRRDETDLRETASSNREIAQLTLFAEMKRPPARRWSWFLVYNFPCSTAFILNGFSDTIDIFSDGGCRNTSGGRTQTGTVATYPGKTRHESSTIQEDGGTEQEIARRIQSGWNSWKKITGVVCDRKVPDKAKEKLHKLMVRPAMLYGLETVPLTKSQERELEVAEMRMMRYEVGVTRLDKIKNETTREMLGIERYGEKIRESRLVRAWV